MSKIRCSCGNIISDSICPCPTEGSLIGDQDKDRLDAECYAAVKSFLAALAAGQKESWMRSFFLPGYPTDLADEEVLSDILSSFEQRYQKSVTECDKCGRLLIQEKSGGNVYRSYSPDKGGYAAVLRGDPPI